MSEWVIGWQTLIKVRLILENTAGISEDRRKIRKRRNIVNTQMNFLAWILQVRDARECFRAWWFSFQIVASISLVLRFLSVDTRTLIWRSLNLAAPPILYLFNIFSGQNRASSHTQTREENLGQNRVSPRRAVKDRSPPVRTIYVLPAASSPAWYLTK